jgi:hypothetical protein
MTGSLMKLPTGEKPVCRHHVHIWNNSGLGLHHLCIAGSIARATSPVTGVIRYGPFVTLAI